MHQIALLVLDVPGPNLTWRCLRSPPPPRPRRWERRESKSNPGKFYFANTVTGEVSVEKPSDIEDVGGDGQPSLVGIHDASFPARSSKSV